MDDEERFTDIFRAFHAQVTAFALRRAAAEVAQDVVAATFLAAWRHLDTLPADPLPWLYRAASLEIAAQSRKDRRHFNMRERLNQTPAADWLQPDHAEQVTSAEQWKEAFAKLSEQDREILRLVAWEKLRPQQAAAVLGCSPAAFKVRLHRARRRLEALMERQELPVDSETRVRVEQGEPALDPESPPPTEAALHPQGDASTQQEA